MNQNFDDLVDEWIEIVMDREELDELDSSSLTWDDEVIREAHRTVLIRALRAASRGRFAA